MKKLFSYKKRIKFSKLNLSKIKYRGWTLQIFKGKLISKNHIDNMIKYINKEIKSIIKNITIRFIKNTILTKKPIESRMGGGKNSVGQFTYQPLAGDILIEVRNIKFEDIYILTKNIKNKFPCSIRLVKIYD